MRFFKFFFNEYCIEKKCLIVFDTLLYLELSTIVNIFNLS